MNNEDMLKKIFENPKAELSITGMQPGQNYLSILALAVENSFNEKGWDQRPVLLAVTDGSGGLGNDVDLVLMSAEEIPLPESVLDAPNPGLSIMAEEVVKITRQQLAADIEAGRRSPIEGHFTTPWLEGFSGQLGDNWAGIAFVYEGWTVKPPVEGDPSTWSDEEVASAAEYSASVMTKGLHEHPDRIEMRGVYFEGVDGSQIMVTRNRDAEPEVALIGRGDADRITGAIPSAIHVFVVIGTMLMIRRGFHRP